jgi:hypothetical protein
MTVHPILASRLKAGLPPIHNRSRRARCTKAADGNYFVCVKMVSNRPALSQQSKLTIFTSECYQQGSKVQKCGVMADRQSHRTLEIPTGGGDCHGTATQNRRW